MNFHQEITLELNQLKQQSDNPEDHADIDTIIQMYRDVADETDYTHCKNLSDYLRVWPTLLLPLPEKIDKLEDQNNDDFYKEWNASQRSN